MNAVSQTIYRYNDLHQALYSKPCMYDFSNVFTIISVFVYVGMAVYTDSLTWTSYE